MKINLILEKTQYNGWTAWQTYKIIPVVLPLDKQDGWQVSGAIWKDECTE